MQFKRTTLLSVVTFLMFLVIGCENPNEPISKQDQSITSSNAATLAKGKDNGKSNDNEKTCNNNNDHNNDHHDGDDDNHHDGNDDNNCSNSGGGSGTCDADGIVTLWGGKTINVGSVTVTQDQNKIYVKYSTTGSWKINETHLDISTSTYTQRGAPGQYDYQSSNGSGVTTYTYTVPITWATGTKIYFLAHAVVGKYSNSKCSSTETAFGGTVVSPKNGSWFATFCTTITTNNPPPPPKYSINGVAFVDVNSNGVQDVGDAGLVNVAVGLNTGATTTTNANGQYSFGGLLAGSYTVSGSAVSGYNQTSSSSVAVVITIANGSANFGYAVIPPTFSISGYAYFDTNGNGVQDSGEPGLANVTITNSNGESTTTDANGFYSFSGFTSNATYSIIGGLVPGMNITSAPTAKVIITNADGGANFGYNDTPVPLRVVSIQPKKL